MHVAFFVCTIGNTPQGKKISSDPSLIDIIYCSPETKARPASVQGVGVDFRLKWISIFHNVVKRLPNRTARLYCVFR